MPRKLPAVSVAPSPIDGVRLKIERGRLTFGDLEDIQELQEALSAQGSPPLRKMRAVLVRFVVDKNGEYMTPDDANEAIRTISFDKIGETFQQFARGVEQVALPPANSNA